MRHSGQVPAVRPSVPQRPAAVPAPSPAPAPVEQPASRRHASSDRVNQLEAALADRVEVELKHAERVAELEEENRAAARRVVELEGERHVLAARAAGLEDDARAGLLRAARAEQRVNELQQELARKHESEAYLELLADGQMTERDRVRGQDEEIQALRLAVDCAHAENRTLQERLANERAHKERLLDEVARVQALLDDLKRLAR